MNSNLRNVVPLSKVVRASIVDVRGDIGRTQEMFSHWAARGMRKLQREVLRNGKRRVLLPISRNTLSATLPPDFNGLLFVGVIDERGKKIPLASKSNIVYIDGVEEIPEDVCESCGQDKNICEEIYISEEVNLIDIDGVLYEESVTKKLQPNGDYLEERQTPIKNLETGLITLEPSSKFVTNFDLKECGCLDDTEDNVQRIWQNCPDIYSNYYANCESGCLPIDVGGYKIFEEEGVIAVEPQYPYDNIFVEYVGFLPKANGQYMVPEVAFETLVNWIKFKSVENKNGVSPYERDWYFKQYVRERSNMEKILHRISLTQIIQAIGLTPKLNVIAGGGWYECYQNNINVMNRNRCQPKRVTRNTYCGENQPQVIQTITKVEKITSSTIYRKLHFSVGDDVVTDVDGPVDYATPLQVGDTTFMINEPGINKDSLHVVLSNQTLNENQPDEISYTVAYGLNGAVVEFNQGAEGEQKYIVSYSKVVSI